VIDTKYISENKHFKVTSQRLLELIFLFKQKELLQGIKSLFE